jgi:polar amino acid transport system substrate-binding protein
MSMRIWKTAATVFAAATIMIGGADAEDVLAEVIAMGELTVGTEMQYAPYDFLENGTQVGFNADLFAEIGKELGVKITFIDLPWPSVLPGLAASKFDLVAGPVSITAERGEQYAFTAPIGQSTFNLLKKAGNTELQAWTKSRAKRLGLRAEVSLEELKIFAASLTPPAEVVEYVDSSQGNADVAAGRIVAFANQTSNTGYTAAVRLDMFAVVPGTFGDLRYVGYVGRKDEASASLIAALNDAIHKVKADGRMATLQERWFGITFELPATVDPSQY